MLSGVIFGKESVTFSNLRSKNVPNGPNLVFIVRANIMDSQIGSLPISDMENREISLFSVHTSCHVWFKHAAKYRKPLSCLR